MNAGRLVDHVRTFLRIDSPGVQMPATAHVLDLLNQAQDEASAELGLPAKLLTVTSQTSPFNLPADARTTDAILELRYAPNTSETVLLPVYSIERAGLEFPNWQQDTATDDPQIAIYSSGIDSMSQVYVHPDPGAANYFVLYKMKPADMVDLNDEPFNGELDRFHIMLAHRVAFDLAGNDQRFAVYRSFMGKAGGVRRRGPKVRNNALYNMTGRFYR